jgi:RHS repeat-associated protein
MPLIGRSLLPRLLAFVAIGPLCWSTAHAALEEYVAPVRSAWEYPIWNPSLQCYASDIEAAQAFVAGTLGFCRWTSEWPQGTDPTGGWTCPSSPTVPKMGHYETRNFTYHLYNDCSPPNEIGANLTGQFWYYCADSLNYDVMIVPGTSVVTCHLKAGNVSPAKQPREGCCVGNPINMATGQKNQREPDYLGAGAFPLRFERFYSAGTWTNTYSRSVEVLTLSGTLTQIWVHREDGRGVPYQIQSGVLVKDADVVEALVQLFNGGQPNGWRFTDAQDTVELYDVSGKLTSLTTRSGLTQTLTYDTNGRLATVTDHHGRQLTLGYDTSGRLATLTVPGTLTYQYGYDTSGRLSTVTYPDAQVRTYLYNEPAYTSGANLPNALTGIQDENGARFATFQYNAQGRAISTEHANGAEHTALTYNANGTVTTTDALGSARTFSINVLYTVGRLGAMTGPECTNCGFSRSLSYDANGNVGSRTDFNNIQATYGYDLARNLQTTRTEASGTPKARTITTQWHATYRLPTQIDEPNRRTTFTHDANGNILTRTVTDLTVTPNVTRTWTYTYNTVGQVLTVNGPRTDVTDVTTYVYYSCSTGFQCGQINTVTDAKGRVTTYNAYNAQGQPLTITDPNSVVTTLGYDSRQRLTSRQVGSEITTFAYWPTGLLKKVTLPDSSYVQYTYDNAHRLTRIDDGAGNHIDYTLDAMDNRTAENVYDPTAFLARTHTRVINSLNQIWKDVSAAGTANVTTVFGYDANGNQTTANAPLSRTTTNAYDELNRLKQITDPATGITQFGYDANDNLTSVSDPRTLNTTYAYNGFGDLKQQVSPDTGTTTITYDSGGNLKTSTDARNKTATYTYDALNRVTQVAYGDQTLTYGYDAGTNGIGRLTSASDANHSMSWIYDGQGRVTTKSQTLGSVTKTIVYGYTNANLTSLTTPSGQSVVFGYNSNHQISSVSVNGTTVLSSVLYDPFGPVRGWTWGNGTSAVRTYDTDGKISQVDSSGLRSYGYDDAFRITSITDTVDGTLSWTYGYDLLDRLTSGNKTGLSQTFSYDANGNRLTQGGTSSTTYTIAASSNRLSSTSGVLARTYTYDAAGNVLTYGTLTYTYNNSGRMKTSKVGSTTTTYVYNALGERVKKSGGAAGTVLYWYDEAGHLLGEYNSSGALVQETVWMGDIPVATLRPGTPAAIFYVHTDHLNTPRKVSRPSDNALRWRWDSDPFGTTVPNQNPAGLGTFAYNLRLPGQYFDTESSLNYNYFRDYDPAIGRYVESDPIGLGAGINTFAYVQNDSVELIDALGLLVWRNVTTYASDLTAKAQWPAYPGALPSIVGPKPTGATIVDWSITSRCVCTATGAKFEEFTVDFQTHVHSRPGLTRASRSFVNRKERDHVRDYNSWANRAGKGIAEEREARYKNVDFTSVEECQEATSSTLDGALRRGGIDEAYRETIRKYDYPGGPHGH